MSASLLLREPPLIVLPSLALVIGLNEAIVLQQIHFRSLEASCADGWVQRPRKAWKAEFPFWHEDTIKRALSQLRTLGLVEAEVVATAQGRESRYRVVYERVEALEGVGANCTDGSGQSAPMGRGRSRRPRTFKGERTAREKEKPASQSSPSTVPDEDRDELLEKRLRDSVIVVLAEQLARAMQANNPRARVSPRSRAWLDPIRLLLDRDGYEPAEVRAMIGWTQADDFERSVVLSPSALRRGVDRIVGKMQRQGVAPFAAARSATSAGDLVDAMTGAAA